MTPGDEVVVLADVDLWGVGRIERPAPNGTGLIVAFDRYPDQRFEPFELELAAVWADQQLRDTIETQAVESEAA